MLTRFIQISALSLALFLGGLAAHASDYTEPAMEKTKVVEAAPDLSNGSEFLYQPEAHKIELMPHLQIGTTVTKYSANNLKRYEIFNPLGVQGEYALNEMFALGLDLTYGYAGRTFTCDTKPCPENNHSTGLMDPTFRFKGRNDIGKGGTIRYGADLALGLEKSKISSSGNSNAASGGTTLAPWIGYEHELGPGFIGGKIQYDLYKGDRKRRDDTAASTVEDPTSTGGDATISNGQNLALTVFYEAKIKKFTLGAAVTYTNRAESRTSLNGAASTPNRDQGSGTDVKFYAPIQINERIAILPTLMFSRAGYSNSNVVDASVTFGAGCGGRFTF